MPTFTACVIDWDANRGRDFAFDIETKCGCPVIIISDYNHETVLLNRAIDICEHKFEYLWFLTSDLEIMYPETPHLMIDYMQRNPEVGAMMPNREGERYVGGHGPYKKYLEDGTALMYRMSVGARYDEELLFTGWSDLDFGGEIEKAGYEIWVDPRTCVNKHPTPYGSWSAFRIAYNARNRLILEAKWYWCGRGKWAGVESWNVNNPERRIPTVFELAFWDEQRLERFAKSVNMEHPQILIKDGQDSGNINWRCPSD